jgi:hypothetical protein
MDEREPLQPTANANLSPTISGKDSPGLEPELQEQIGVQLRAVYDEVLNEPIPDRFLKLLEELERSPESKP